MSDLVAWLTQILDEDERAAKAVKPLGEVVVMGGEHHPESFGHSRHTVASEDGYPRTLSDPEASQHFARHEPSAVLARIAADRQILALCKATLDAGDEYEDVHRTDLWYVMRYLAAPHADRPGFRDEWRVAP